MASNYGEGPDTCNLNVVAMELYHGISPEQYVDEMRTFDFERHDEESLGGDFEVQRKFEDEVSLQPAVRVVSHWSSGGSEVMQEQVMLMRDGRTYTITCMTPVARYPEVRAIFDAFFGLFVIHQ